MQLALGAVYAWSVFRAPLASALGASVTQVNLAFTIANVTLGVAAFVGGLWLARVGPRVVAVTAGHDADADRGVEPGPAHRHGRTYLLADGVRHSSRV